MYFWNSSEDHLPAAWIVCGVAPARARAVAPPARKECPLRWGSVRNLRKRLMNHERVGMPPSQRSQSSGKFGKSLSRDVKYLQKSRKQSSTAEERWTRTVLP
jgi:hypothetical protein